MGYYKVGEIETIRVQKLNSDHDIIEAGGGGGVVDLDGGDANGATGSMTDLDGGGASG